MLRLLQGCCDAFHNMYNLINTKRWLHDTQRPVLRVGCCLTAKGKCSHAILGNDVCWLKAASCSQRLDEEEELTDLFPVHVPVHVRHLIYPH